MEQNYIQELLNLIRSELDDNSLREELSNYHENDIAKIFPYLTEVERLKLYRIIEQNILSDIFSYLENPKEYLDELSNEKAADIIEGMDTDDAIDVLEEFEEEERQELIQLMDEEAVEDIKLIQSYEEDMIGSKMTTNYISVNKKSTVRQAMKRIVEEAAENDNVSVIYFVDEDETFFGAMDLRDLIIARQGDNLLDLIMTSYPYLLATELVEDCINKIQEYALDSIPVVDENNKLIGVITSDDIIEVVQDELSDDYAKLAGLTDEESLEESTFKSVKKRIPWLMILLGLGLITSLLISSFEEVVATLPIIVFFQSLILSMAGNTGTQSLAVTIRVITDNDLTNKEIFKLIFKEIKIGFLNGLLIGILSFGVVFGFLWFFEDIELSKSLNLCAAISISMLGSMFIASLAGTTIPVIFKKCNIDPAIASGPLITTLNDVIAVVIYYGLAWLLLLSL